jgi:hypothetical protein
MSPERGLRPRGRATDNDPHRTATRPGRVAGSTVPVVALEYGINSGALGRIKCGHALAGTSASPQLVPSLDLDSADSIGMTFDESSSTEY